MIFLVGVSSGALARIQIELMEGVGFDVLGDSDGPARRWAGYFNKGGTHWSLVRANMRG
jgi:hypothetical protein